MSLEESPQWSFAEDAEEIIRKAEFDYMQKLWETAEAITKHGELCGCKNCRFQAKRNWQEVFSLITEEAQRLKDPL